MEEPLSALDSQTRELLMEDFIRLLADGAMGAAYVTHNLEEAVRLADRIVVLSRRPGRVREVVSIPLTRAERGELGARGELLALQSELWSLIREQAIDAEREVQHACAPRTRHWFAARGSQGRNAPRGVSRRRLYPESRPLFRLDSTHPGNRTLATRRQRRLGQ